MTKRIAFHESKCTFCHLCSLYCSLEFAKVQYQPSISRIRVAENADDTKYAAHVCLQCVDPACAEAYLAGAHPSATCRINDVVDENLETRIENLYCCDASVIPESLGLPLVWTVVALGKRLAKHMNEKPKKSK